MSAEAAIAELYARIQQLQVMLRQVRTTVIEDRPTPREHVVVDRFADAADTLCGWLAEAMDAALAAEQTVDRPDAMRALESCHIAISKALETFFGDMAGHEQIAALLKMGHEHGPPWRMWARTVVRAIDDCHQPMLQLNKDVFHCCLAVAALPEYSGRSR